MRLPYKRLAAVLFITGVSLSCASFLESFSFRGELKQSIADYQEEIEQAEDDRLSGMWDEALQYNEALFEGRKEAGQYGKCLNFSGDGLMCYIKIPAINTYLPVYHGTDEQTLAKGAGHMIQSSLPVGGQSSHCVISAHSGLPGKQMFDYLDKLKTGDLFYLYTLDRTLAYEVDQVQTVLPYEMNALKIAQGRDYVTLLTCTPYGINSHRLLVRGRRTACHEQQAELIQDRSDSVGAFDNRAAVHFAAWTALAAVFLVSRTIRRRRRKWRRQVLRKQVAFYKRKVKEYARNQK